MSLKVSSDRELLGAVKCGTEMEGALMRHTGGSVGVNCDVTAQLFEKNSSGRTKYYNS